MGSEERYPMKRSKFSSHSKIAFYLNDQIFVRRGGEILDIGCAKGEMRNLLQGDSIRYVGVEPFLEDYLSAKANGLEMVYSSAENAVKEINSQFDFIIFADVLEHLQNPTIVLKECHNLLNPEGEIVISIPNVAHFSNRLGLLFGMWNYAEKGILDKTHLRFYTKSSFQREIQDCGFFIKRSSNTPIPLEALFPRMNKYLFKCLDFILYYPTLIYPKLFGYQLLFIISPVDQRSSP
jgi:SAM-dependent methyltransferase